jgi:hypothetical protein
MSRCALCPNEADVYWDPPEIMALTPEGVALVERIEELVPEKPRAFMCTDCYIKHANGLGEAHRSEALRRAQKPS